MNDFADTLIAIRNSIRKAGYGNKEQWERLQRIYVFAVYAAWPNTNQ